MSTPANLVVAAQAPCSACSWTLERQKQCSYHSNVKLFYSASDRGVWSVGSKLIIKERSSSPPNFEAVNIQFLQTKTTIPIPSIVEEWNDDNGRYFMVMKRVPGRPLSEAWTHMSTVEKDRVAEQTACFLEQLRELRSPRMESLEGGPLFSSFLFLENSNKPLGEPYGPLSTDEELWEEMAKSLGELSEKARERLRERMPSGAPYTFTHGDLTNVNIMVENGNLTGIIDWEVSGYFPVWWEFVCTGIGYDEDDKEWKDLLRKHMLCDHTKAREFWRDYYALSRYSNPGLEKSMKERAKKLLDELETPSASQKIAMEREEHAGSIP